MENGQKIKLLPKQLHFYKSQTKFIAGVAGLGGGKTTVGAIKALGKSGDNKGIKGCVTAPTYKMLRDATIPKYEEMFTRYAPGYATFLGIAGDKPMAKFGDGGSILFRSTEKPDNLRALEIGWFHMDEAAMSPHVAFQVLRGRLRQRSEDGSVYPYQGWMTTTPRGLNWIYTEFALDKRDKYELIQWATKDNFYLPEDYIEDMGYTGKMALQEQEGQFIIMTGECLFETEKLKKRLGDCRDGLPDPNYVLDIPVTDVRLADVVSVWKPPFVGTNYLCGADCADEGGNGVNDAVIMNWNTGEEVCGIHGDISADLYALILDRVCRKYNNCYLAPERNGTVGGAVTTRLKDMEYPNLYKDSSDRIGWWTGTNRFDVLSEYKIAVDRNQTMIYSREAIAEMMTFIQDASGKYRHIEGGTDDMVMSRSICWGLRNKKNPNNVIRLQAWKRPFTTCA